jgi:hypothetical protein
MQRKKSMLINENMKNTWKMRQILSFPSYF